MTALAEVNLTQTELDNVVATTGGRVFRGPKGLVLLGTGEPVRVNLKQATTVAPSATQAAQTTVVPNPIKRKPGRPSLGEHPEKLMNLFANGKSGDVIILDAPVQDTLDTYILRVRSYMQGHIGSGIFEANKVPGKKQVLVKLK